MQVPEEGQCYREWLLQLGLGETGRRERRYSSNANSTSTERSSTQRKRVIGRRGRSGLRNTLDLRAIKKYRRPLVRGTSHGNGP